MLWSLIGGQTISGRPDRLSFALLASAVMQVGMVLLAGTFEVELPEAERAEIAREHYMRYVGRYVTDPVPPKGGTTNEPGETLTEEEPEPLEAPESAEPTPRRDKPSRSSTAEVVERDARPMNETPMETKSPQKTSARDVARAQGKPEPGKPERPAPGPAERAVELVSASTLLDDPLGEDVPGVALARPSPMRGHTSAFDPVKAKPGHRLTERKPAREKLRELAREKRQDSPPSLATKELLADRGGVGGGTAEERRAIKDAMGRASPRFRRCLEHTQLTSPDISGRILISFVIGAGGRPQQISTRVEPQDHRQLADCILRVVAELRFEPPRGQRDINVNYPLRIRSPL